MDHGRMCCNPFGSYHSNYITLYNVSENNIQTAKEIGVEISGDFICSPCRKRLSREKDRGKRRSVPVKVLEKSVCDDPIASTSSTQTTKMLVDPIASTSSAQSTEMLVDLDEEIGPISSDSAKEGDSDESVDLSCIDVDEVKEATNELLLALNLSAIDNAKLRTKKYQADTIKKITTHLNHVLFPEANPFDAYEQMIKQLKEKFNETSNRNMKMKILSVFPNDWSFSKFREVFGDAVSQHMVYQTKKLVEKSGILSDTTKKIGSKSIDQKTIERVHEFYCSEKISRPCPGIREYVSHKINGEKVKIQRRLILMNLNEAFQIFKTENPEHKIGFSKFAAVRPKQCVLAGSTHGIHTTCVCVYHQNPKLIFESLKGQFDLKQYKFETYRDMMNMLLCKKATEECRLNQCKQCPGIAGNDDESGLGSILFQMIDEEIYENISFKQWINAGSEYI